MHCKETFSRLFQYEARFVGSCVYGWYVIAVKEFQITLDVLVAPLLSSIDRCRWRCRPAPGFTLARRISRTHRRGENIISGSGPFLIFRLHYDVLQTSWVANSIANALNSTLLRSDGYRGAGRSTDLFEFLPRLNLGNCSAGGVGEIKTST